MYTGDLEPDLELVLRSRTQAIDLTPAESVRIIGRRGSDIVFDREPDTTTIVGDTSIVTMEWQSGDTDERGRIQIEVEVTWPGARTQTFRADGGVDIKTDFDLADV